MKYDYFDIMVRQAHCSLTAAELLVSILENYRPEKIAEYRDEMHALEHSGDEIRHGVLRNLARDFITPIEREDLLQLIQILDDVTDAIDEVVIELYMYNLSTLPADVIKMAKVVRQCVKALEEAVMEFRRFKKSDKLLPLLVEVNTIESEADTAYIEAMHNLFLVEKDPLKVIGARAIYHSLESCCDLCEHAADVIENTVMNNT